MDLPEGDFVNQPERSASKPPSDCPLCNGEGFMFNGLCTTETCGYYADHAHGRDLNTGSA